jgi:NAD(P)-dependent dehydrogenase (short-subunit alcohol dehydrogenase family)
MSRVVVVTGAARGIGAAIASSFVQEGDEVVALDLNDPVEPVPGARHVRCDVADPASVEAAFAELERVDVLVNNAGIQRVAALGTQAVDDWLGVIATNLTGAWLCCRQSVGKMEPGSAIVSIASAAAIVGLPGRTAYSAAKAGLLGLTRTLGVELAPRRIRVNAVCPGFTRTDLVQQGIDDGSLDLEWMLERVTANRLAESAEIARAVSFLAGDDASYVTGQALVVDGGWTVQGIGAVPEWLAGP